MFYENLKAICDEKGVKITPLVVECGGTKGMLSGWKKGASPSIEIVAKIALRLNVSTDLLILENNLEHDEISNNTSSDRSISFSEKTDFTKSNIYNVTGDGAQFSSTVPDTSAKGKGKYSISMGKNNTYFAPVHNTTGKKVTVNNMSGGSSNSAAEHSDNESKYPTVIMYLESLDEKNKRHAVVDIEYMLENEYNISEQTVREHSGDTGYQRIVDYLDSLDEKKRRHAVVDVEYLLENEYGVKKNVR